MGVVLGRVRGREVWRRGEGACMNLVGGGGVLGKGPAEQRARGPTNPTLLFTVKDWVACVCCPNGVGPSSSKT